MSTEVIILNGGSSSGKSRIARCLQDVLPRPWLTFGCDTLVDALPAAMRTSEDPEGGIGFGPDGSVSVGDDFRLLDIAWARGIGAMARAGARIVVDEVFLGGPDSQERWRTALTGLDVLWVGVRCDPEVAAAREAARGDRATGMARSQADLVHRGVRYDLEVDTSRTPSLACARTIAARVTG
ncbi:chloramphenicol phosphotransferase CPT [Streptomyces sp. NPDC008317]|uniref:chloramphenicol phosphotransferase CPT n=1 Tax=Streptomyces sp. NPDC008317 TaxID=3364827 RepID=UPI0036E8D422